MMKCQFDAEDLAPLVRLVVNETIKQLRDDEAKLGNQIAYPESIAASLIGVERHALRDARLRGEIAGSRVGKRILYEREELLAFLRRTQT